MRRPPIRPLAVLATVLLAALAATSSPVPQSPEPPPAEDVLTRAEAFYEEGSFARAHELYREAAELVDAAEKRWIAFRLADTRWRAGDRAVDEARGELEEMVREGDADEDLRDEVWREAHESLGDLFWTRRGQWHQAWPHYQAVLDAWAGHPDLGLARRRYLGAVWKIADHQEGIRHGYAYGYGFLPVEVLKNVLKIAANDEERSRAHFLIAVTLKQRGGGSLAGQRQVTQAFAAALAGGRSNSWHGDALYHYAEWLANSGRVIYKAGGWSRQPDYRGAVELYRRLLREYEKGETRYYDQARAQLERITGTQLGVHTSQVFLPGSEVEYQLTWRNAGRVELALYPLDLWRDVDLGGQSSSSGWQQRPVPVGREAVRTWTLETGDIGDHEPGQRGLRLAEPPPAGAYLLTARAGETKAQDLLLVTDVALVVRTSGPRTLIYVCDAVDGSPLPGARVVLQEYLHQERRWQKRSLEVGDDGLAVTTSESQQLFVTAAIEERRRPPGGIEGGNRQAYAAAYSNRGSRAGRSWRIYAFTDRPAYRPGETARFKSVARLYDDGTYSTPHGEILHYEIQGPRGSKVGAGELDLNAFGSAWAELSLTEEMALGVYNVRFSDSRNDSIGTAQLFRLEEYKLPELQVRVTTPREDDGSTKSFRLGETVEVEVAAEYYFGGAAAGADVELMIYQKFFYPWWRPPRPFPWFYESRRYGYDPGPGQLLERKIGKTDDDGRIRFTFETPAQTDRDFEYRLEARVVDSSRREVVGSGSVRVTRQGYYVYPRARHNLYRPRERVEVDFTVRDANDRPRAVTGTVRVTRDRWLPESRGYEHEEILKRTVTTDVEGRAELAFRAAEEGYYRIAWTSEDEDGMPVEAQTTVWVATRETRHLGYHHEGVEILLDRDTFRAGETAPVMLSTANSNRWVLFTVEAEEILDYRLVHLDGTVKLLELAIGEEHVPNFFLNAVLVEDGAMAVDHEEVVVPPVRKFLDVTVEADREHYEPREKGYLTVTARDHEGRPVSAEVGLALVDEAVFYIQEDLAGDPRQFFYGDKRSSRVRTSSSFDERPYRRLEGREDEGVVEDFAAVGRFADSVGGEASRQLLAVGRAGERVEMRSRLQSVAKKEAAQAPAPSAAPAGAAAVQAVQVRTDFRATVLWQPDVTTGDDGRARVEVTYPDSLTSWKATARVAAEDSRFGIAESVTRTRMPLIVRLQAPRFFVVGDRVTVSAILNNDTEEEMRVLPSLEAVGLDLVRSKAEPVTVAAHGEGRVDWTVVASEPGTAKLTVAGRAGEHADAMRKEYPVHEHGITKRVTAAGKVRGDEETVTVELPPERRSTRFTVQLAPSLAVTMLDALPYLIDYPYGCTEQTMSRFLPAVITAGTLEDLSMRPPLRGEGLERGAIEERVFGGVETATAQETHPDGRKDLRELDDMVEKGLERLYDFQHGDGGWGWWKKGDSDHFMTAYVVWGLVLARDAGIAVKKDTVLRAARFLEDEIVEAETNPSLQAWMLHALGRHHALSSRREPSPHAAQALENLWRKRERLVPYSRALLAIAAHDYGDGGKADVLARNLENGAVVEGDTAHWGERRFYWRWRDGAVESTAFVLMALQAIDPDHRLVEPAMTWLVKNRRGAQWSNTRDTAIVVLALNEYLKRSGELTSDQEVDVFVNGRRVAQRRFTKDDVLAAPRRIPVALRDLRDGANEIRIVRRGEGALYYAAEAEYFSLEEPVTPAGYEIFVRREYFKLEGRPTLFKGYVYDKVPLGDGETVKSGERVEVVLQVEAKNDYEYLVFEDLKPAGFEAVQVKSGESLWARELRSGEPTGRSRWVYQELRDRKVALFVDKLAQGKWEIRYELRAEVPGEFHALPVTAQAMYVPEIRGNGQEVRVRVVDR